MTHTDSRSDSRTVQAYRAAYAATWQPFLAAWHARFESAPQLASAIVRELDTAPDSPLALAYPLRGYPHTAKGARVALGTALTTIEGAQDRQAPYQLARGRYDGHSKAWYWSVATSASDAPSSVP